MFVLEGGASARIKTDEERDEVNALLRLYQEQFGVTFASFRDALLFMARNPIAEPNSTVNTGEVIEVERIKEQSTAYAEKHGLPTDSSTEDIVLHSLIHEPDPIKVTETTEVEVEKKLSENQVLIDLNADQYKILETVNGNRNKLLPDYGKPLESFADTLTESFFHKGTLFNWHEQFYTGLNE